MRKLFALAMVAALSLTIALAAVGCGQQASETTESTPPAEQSSMPADTGMGAAADTGMSHMDMDSTMHQ
jgi:hypothetical protein